jgi:hypothetical protein
MTNRSDSRALASSGTAVEVAEVLFDSIVEVLG